MIITLVGMDYMIMTLAVVGILKILEEDKLLPL